MSQREREKFTEAFSASLGNKDPTSQGSAALGEEISNAQFSENQADTHLQLKTQIKQLQQCWQMHTFPQVK